MSSHNLQELVIITLAHLMSEAPIKILQSLICRGKGKGRLWAFNNSRKEQRHAILKAFTEKKWKKKIFHRFNRLISSHFLYCIITHFSLKHFNKWRCFPEGNVTFSASKSYILLHFSLHTFQHHPVFLALPHNPLAPLPAPICFEDQVKWDRRGMWCKWPVNHCHGNKDKPNWNGPGTALSALLPKHEPSGGKWAALCSPLFFFLHLIYCWCESFHQP